MGIYVHTDKYEAAARLANIIRVGLRKEENQAGVKKDSPTDT